MSSSSRVWFITGTSSGIGRNLLDAILATDERVVATLRNTAVLEPLAVEYSPEKLLILQLDVTIPAQISAAFERVKSHFGRIDVVVNNAGYGLVGEIEGTSDEDARKQIEVLFWGPVNVCKHALKFFREVNPPEAGGRILNISSAGGFSGNPLLSFYSAGKFALEGFTEALSKEVPQSWNIKATIIEPGGFRTEWNKGGMITLPPHPAYAGPDTPSSQFRPLIDSIRYEGDPAKAAQAIIAISKVEEPPVRLQLGNDSMHVVKTKVHNVLKEMETWESLSSSTAADDAEDYIHKLGPAATKK